MPKPTVGIRLEEETQQRLKSLGEKRDRSPHYLMREAIEKFLEQEEEIEAENALMRERWERYQLTGETIPHAEVQAWANSLPDE